MNFIWANRISALSSSSRDGSEINGFCYETGKDFKAPGNAPKAFLVDL